MPRGSYIGRWKPTPQWHKPEEECGNKTSLGTCLCRPKCKMCGWGPHMGIHKTPMPLGHQFIPRSKP